MRTSHPTPALSKPTGSDPISERTLAYLQTRNRLRVFKLVQQAFEKSGLSQVTLAARLRKDPSQLNRLLGAPGNWTLDTVSDLLFAITGGVPEYSIGYPLDKPKRNDTKPSWSHVSPADSSSDDAPKLFPKWFDAIEAVPN